MRSLAVAILGFSSVALSAQAPPPQPARAPGTDKASATAVVIDVVVRDKSGRPVVNLGPDDFEIFEDGVRQPLGSFRAPIAAGLPEAATDTGTPAAAAAAASAAPRATPAPEPAVMAFVFDNLALESRNMALAAVRKYVGAQTQTPNWIAVLDIEPVAGAKLLVPFTRDTEAILESLKNVSATRPAAFNDPQHVTDLRGPTAQGLYGGPRITDALTIANASLGGLSGLEANVSGWTAMRGLSATIAGMSRAPGRKSIVFFSQGVALNRDTDPRFYELIDRANRANVAIYTVDTPGLRTEDPMQMVGRQAASQDPEPGRGSGFNLSDAARTMPEVGLGLLADQTGALFVGSTNDLYRAFPRLDEDLRSYYALTYAAPRAEPDLKFHKIQVKVKRPGLVAKTRSGYTSRPPDTGGMPILSYEAAALARLEAAPLPNDLPVLARGLVFPVAADAASTAVLVSVPTGGLEYVRDDAAGTFEAQAVVLVRVRDAQGQVVHKASEQYSLKGPLAGLDQSRGGELLFYRQPQLPPGVYTLEAIVQDERSGKASARISSIDVPRPGESTLQLGSPFIVRRAERTPHDAKNATNPLFFGEVLISPNLGQPVSKADKELAFGFTAYGTPSEAVLELTRAGQTVARVPLPLNTADAQGRIQQVSRLPLTSLPAGNYDLRITLAAGDQRISRGVGFSLVN